MTAPRARVHGETLAMTRRTNLRKFVLGNWDPQVSQIYLYSLGAAALGADDGMGERLSEAVFHQICLMGTHPHVLLTDVRGRAPRIFCRAHSWSAKAINVLLAKRGYQRLGQVYDGRQISFVRTMDWSAELKQVLYQFLNPVAAGLCEKAADYDGVCTPLEWIGGYRLRVKRPDVFFDPSFPAEVILVFGPPPAAYIAYGGDTKRMVADLRSDARKQEKAIAAMRPFPVLGERKMHPWDEPNTLVERWSPNRPLVTIGVGGAWERKRLRELVRAEVEQFCVGHEKVRQEEKAQIARRVKKAKERRRAEALERERPAQELECGSEGSQEPAREQEPDTAAREQEPQPDTAREQEEPGGDAVPGEEGDEAPKEERDIVYPYGTYKAARERRHEVKPPSGEAYFLAPGVFDEGWASRYVECELPKEVVLVTGRAVADEERRSEREESAQDVSDFYGTMYDKLVEREKEASSRASSAEVEDQADEPTAATDRNQQKSATKRPSIQPPMAPHPVRERYEKRPDLSDTNRVTVRRDLLRPGGAPRSDEDPD